MIRKHHSRSKSKENKTSSSSTVSEHNDIMISKQHSDSQCQKDRNSASDTVSEHSDVTKDTQEQGDKYYNIANLEQRSVVSQSQTPSDFPLQTPSINDPMLYIYQPSFYQSPRSGSLASYHDHSFLSSHAESSFSSAENTHFFENTSSGSSMSSYHQPVQTNFDNSRELHTPIIVSGSHSDSKHLSTALPGTSKNMYRELHSTTGEMSNVSDRLPYLTHIDRPMSVDHSLHLPVAINSSGANKESEFNTLDLSEMSLQRFEIASASSQELNMSTAGRRLNLSQESNANQATQASGESRIKEWQYRERTEHYDMNSYSQFHGIVDQKTLPHSTGQVMTKSKFRIPQSSHHHKLLRQYANSLPVINEFDEVQQCKGNAPSDKEQQMLSRNPPPYPVSDRTPLPPINHIFPHLNPYPSTYDSGIQSCQPFLQASCASNSDQSQTLSSLSSSKDDDLRHHYNHSSYEQYVGSECNLIQPSHPLHVSDSQNYMQVSHSAPVDSYNLMQHSYPANVEVNQMSNVQSYHLYGAKPRHFPRELNHSYIQHPKSKSDMNQPLLPDEPQPQSSCIESHPYLPDEMYITKEQSHHSQIRDRQSFDKSVHSCVNDPETPNNLSPANVAGPRDNHKAYSAENYNKYSEMPGKENLVSPTLHSKSSLKGQELPPLEQPSSSAGQAPCCMSVFAPGVHEPIIMHHYPHRQSGQKQATQETTFHNESSRRRLQKSYAPNVLKPPNALDYSKSTSVSQRSHGDRRQQRDSHRQNAPAVSQQLSSYSSRSDDYSSSEASNKSKSNTLYFAASRRDRNATKGAYREESVPLDLSSVSSKIPSSPSK
ncbi:hypothetical protein SK128_027427 [Halocaridina rubra]|uniref:Uncharacterized protein n=1 Tax=Halocaridina rubra TaxID=373956 RepID=A0AAN8WQ77_HALRR